MFSRMGTRWHKWWHHELSQSVKSEWWSSGTWCIIVSLGTVISAWWSLIWVTMSCIRLDGCVLPASGMDQWDTWEYTHMLWRVQMLETAHIKGESLYCVPAITRPFDICSCLSNTGTGLFSTLCVIIMSVSLGTAGLKVHQSMHKLPLTARSDIMNGMHRQVVSYHAQQGILDLPYQGWSSCVLLMALRKDQSDHCCYAIDRCYLWASCWRDP